MENKKSTNFNLANLFIFFGIGLLLITGMDYYKLKDCKKTEGKVVYCNATGDDTYTPTVRYYAYGKQYENESKSSSSKCMRGEKITIYYNKKNPNEVVYIKDTIILSIVSIIFAAAGIFVKRTQINLDKMLKNSHPINKAKHINDIADPN